MAKIACGHLGPSTGRQCSRPAAVKFTKLDPDGGMPEEGALNRAAQTRCDRHANGLRNYLVGAGITFAEEQI